MNAKQQDNVEPFPEREPMPEEFAAISFQVDPEAEATVLLNSEQEHHTAREALRKLKPHVLIPVLIGSIAGKLAEAFRKHPAASALVSTLAATSITTASVVTMLDAYPRPPQGPPAAAREGKARQSPSPATAWTVTVTPARTADTKRSRPPSPTPSAITPSPSEQAAVPAAADPTSTRTPSPSESAPTDRRPTPAPTPRPRRPTGGPLPELVDEVVSPPPLKPSLPSPLPTDLPSVPEIMADDECVVRVDIRPLLDVCVGG